MKQVHIKQTLIASAIVGVLMVPGSAMTVHAADKETKESAASQIVGIESTQKNDKITVATVTADVLNVRAGQGTDYQILLQILEQEKYEVTGDSVNGWYPITVGAVDGWVSGEWVVVDKVDKAEFLADEQQMQENVEDNIATQEAVALSTVAYTTGQQVIDFACQFIGNPYVWGGTSLTNGADCSGFVQSVYANFGISLPRTTWDMENVGYEVPYDQAQPGDLILYDGHVGLYMGDGNIVNAMNEVDGIGICTATYAPIVTVRRVL